MSRIVEDLIDVSRVVEKKIELRRERVALTKVVETAVETCRSRIEACGHRLSIALPGEPLFLDVDPARISQVLTNLLNNAAKYTSEGGEIQLSAESAQPATGQGSPTEVVLRVRDSGVGIREELLPHIFDLYFQGEPVPETLRSGLGVGLTLVRSLVQMHGGEVKARSGGPGLGSELTVRLPLATIGSPECGTVSEKSPPSEARGANPKRILVVDDNEDQAETLARLLRVLGHEVRIAFDGLSALVVAADLVPDLALVDIGLPGINGFEVARKIRQQPSLRHAVLVAQTGWGQDEDRRRSIEAGFDHHMVKPLDFDTLRKILGALPASQADSAREPSP
jgi:CheY-like chemotaxis protein/two-component sensor histidine kinase